MNDGRLIQRHVGSIRLRDTNDSVDTSFERQDNPQNLHTDLYLPDIPNQTTLQLSKHRPKNQLP